MLYSFPLAGGPSELFVFSDRYKDVLAVYAIDPDTGNLRDVSDPASSLIFTPAGEEPDGETTAYGLATYRDATTDTFYAFVSRRETNKVAQLELVAHNRTVSWEKVRTIALPLPDDFTGDNPQVEGMVVDPELGFAYFAQEQVGI